MYAYGCVTQISVQETARGTNTNGIFANGPMLAARMTTTIVRFPIASHQHDDWELPAWQSFLAKNEWEFNKYGPSSESVGKESSHRQRRGQTDSERWRRS